MNLARLCILLVLAQLAPALYAAVNQWTGAIPLKVTSIRSHPGRPSLMYLVSDGDLYSTEDEGRTVTALNKGLPYYRRIAAFELDPSNPSTLYLVNLEGLFRSDNAGHNWRSVLTWNLGWQGAKLAIDPKNGQTLYLVSVDGQIKKSSDRGRTWAGVSFTEHVSCLTVSPSDPKVLYAGTTEGNVWRSTNSGTDWNRLPDTVAHPSVQSLVVDPLNADIVYKAAYGEGWLKSTDGGRSWIGIIGGLGAPSTPPFLFISPNSPNTLFSGFGSSPIYRSVDGGASWDQISRSVGKSLSLIAASPDGHTLFAAGANRLYKSTDNGINWISAIPTIEETGPAELVVHPKASDTMYAFNQTGASRSTDGGTSWRHLGGGLPNGFLTDLEIDPRDSRAFFVGVWGNGVYRNKGTGDTWQLLLTDNEVFAWHIEADPIRPGCIFAIGNTLPENPPHAYRTTDGGESWARIEPGTGDARFIWQLVFDPVTAGIVYIATTAGVYKSTDGGDTWVAKPHPPKLGSGPGASVLAIDPRNPRVLLCASAGQLFRTTDGADTWTWLGGAFSTLPDGERIGRLAFSPHDSTVYASGGKAIYRSTDSGSYWTAMPDGFPWPTFSPNDPDVLFGVKRIWPSNAETFQRSDDRGATWYPVRHDLRFALILPPLRIDPTDSNTVFALAYHEGVYKSTDGSVTWARASEGLSADVSVMEIDPSNHGTLFAAGNDGAFRTTDGALRWERVSDLPMSFLTLDHPHIRPDLRHQPGEGVQVNGCRPKLE